jgi:histidinol-phosphate aminotransferase
MEAIQQVTPEQLRRYPSPSAALFREAASKLLDVPPDWIMTFNGGDDLLSVIIRACAAEGDSVVFPEPSYSLYPVLAELHGAKQEVVSYEISGSNWTLPKGIENSKSALMLIVNPNAPSGHFNPISQLAEIAGKFAGVLLIDEAYVDFAEQSALPLVEKYPNVVLLRSMSKGYALAGLRFGYAIGQPSILSQLEKVRDSYPCDVISIAAATAAIQDQDYARANWEKVKLQRAYLTSALRILGFSLPDSQANFVLTEVSESSPLTAENLYLALKQRKILVRWWQSARLSNKLRITIGTPEQNEQLLGILRDLLGL